MVKHMELNLTTLNNGEVVKYDEDFTIDPDTFKSVGIIDL